MLLLILLCLQDWKNRSIRTDMVLFLLLCLGLSSFLNDRQTFFHNSLVNACVLAVHVLALVMFSKFRHGLSLHQVFGLGDTFFLFATIPALTPKNYVLFILLSAIFALVGSHLMNHKQNIPFVSYLAVTFIPFLITKFV